jgi:4'-phosphopantetheinyl transferase
MLNIGRRADLGEGDRNALHLWCAYPDDLLNEEVAQACASLLSEEERARWQAFKFERLQREYLTTRALVRTALSNYKQISPAAWRFSLNDYGKPAIDPADDLQFNLSNSSGLVVCLIGKGSDVGVDVEPSERAGQIAEVAHRVFSARELAQLATLTGDERLDRGLSLWTLKEAYIKARGMGLSLPLDKISFVFDAEGVRLELDRSLNDEPGRWRFCLLDHAGHRVALMTEGDADPVLEIWDAHPLVSPPARIANSGARWHSK